jgi:hypothetical protein
MAADAGHKILIIIPFASEGHEYLDYIQCLPTFFVGENGLPSFRMLGECCYSVLSSVKLFACELAGKETEPS